MNQHNVEIVGFHIAHAAFDTPAGVLGTKVEKGFSGGKFFAYFGANNPLIAVAQKPTYTLFATAVGGRCVEKVNAAFAGDISQRFDRAIDGQRKTGGVFHLLVAAEFNRAQA